MKENDDKIIGGWEVKDISAQVFGKYQHCTMYKGKWYADSDFTYGSGVGVPKAGAIPAPDGKPTPYVPDGEDGEYLGDPPPASRPMVPASWTARLFRHPETWALACLGALIIAVIVAFVR